ncbi:MAG TPA: hypothetical protein VFZ42_11405 [Chitinophagaceae bacterium]
MKAFFLIFCLPISTIAQDVTGIWTGTIYTQGNELPYELVISNAENKLSGYSLTTFTINGVPNSGLKSMKIKNKNGKLTIEDDELIDDNYTIKSKRMMLFSVLTVTGKDSSLMLTGPFNARSYNNTSYKGTILLKKKSNHSQTSLVKKLEQLSLHKELSFLQPEKKTVVVSSSTATRDPEPKKGNQFAEKVPTPPLQPVSPVITAPAAQLAARKIQTLQTIGFVSDSIVLFLYDNGQVDGDTVSVVLNGQIIIPKRGLSEKAITYTIYTQPGLGDSLQLVMYAENLGRIPPNTGLLVVIDGSNRHEVRFSGDLQQNSAIILKRRR